MFSRYALFVGCFARTSVLIFDYREDDDLIDTFKTHDGVQYSSRSKFYLVLSVLAERVEGEGTRQTCHRQSRT